LLASVNVFRSGYVLVKSKSVTKVTVKLQVKSGTGTITFDIYGTGYFGSPIRSVTPLLALPPAQ